MEKIGKYSITDEIARGSMGIIYRGVDDVLGRAVAIKVMSDNLVTDDMMVTRFQNEAKAAALLGHQNIVTIYDFGEDAGVFFLVMELLDGCNLKEYVEQNPGIDIKEKLSITLKIAEGLEYAHKHNVVHRDVKPANIMILSNGDVKITDFGIAHLESSHITRTGTLVGTPDYMSPEQVLSKKVDQRSDIFSLGVILYQLISGRKPFQANSISSVMYKIANDDPPSFEALKINIPFEVESIVIRSLEKDPMKRYQNLQSMIGDIKTAMKLLSGEKTEDTFTAIAETKYLVDESERLLKENRPDEALTVLEKAKEKDPDNKLIHTLIEKASNASLKEKNQRIRKIILRAETAAEGGNLEEALLIAQSAFDILPGNSLTKEFVTRVKKQISDNTGESEDSIETRILDTYHLQKKDLLENEPDGLKKKDKKTEQTDFHSTGTKNILMSLPRNLRILLEEADNIYYRRQNVIEVIFSINKLMKALSIDPESYEAIYRLSRNYYMKGNMITRVSEQKRAFNQGISWAKRAVELIDTRVEGHYWLAVNLAKWGDVNGIFRGSVIVKKMLRELERAIELDSHYSGGGAYRVLGRIKFRLPSIIGGDIDESINLLQKALEIEPKHPDTLMFLAESYIGKNMLTEAKDTLDELMTIEPHPQWRYETEHDRKLAEDIYLKIENLSKQQ